MNKYAIIVAGGSGSRMGSAIPKQFLLLHGKPILLYTLQRFIDYPEPLQIILVLPASQIDEWKKICKEHQFEYPIKVVTGGDTRFQSVKNGLKFIGMSDGLVAIHDGVRPFIHHSVIRESFEKAALSGNAIASVPLKDSIRFVDNYGNRSENRTKYRLIQTPQTFQLSLIQKAFQTPELASFTDDASVLENMGEKIELIEGSYENIKITTPEDLIIAEAICNFFRG